MDIKKKQQPIIKKPVFWVLAVVVIIVLAAAILEKTGVTNFLNTTPPQGPTTDQQEQDAEAAAAKKKEVIENDGTKADPYSTSDPAANNTTIDLSAKQESNGTVTVFTKLYGYSTGSCKLDVTNGSKSSSQTAEAMYQPEYASCEGFSISVDPLGKGVWTIKLSVTSAGSTKDKTISFEVK